MTTITRDHLTLLAHASWRMSDCEYGAPEMDGKRPYGNSGVEDDLEELLPHLDEDERVQIHRDLVKVIPAIIRAYTESLPAEAEHDYRNGERVKWNPTGDTWLAATVEELGQDALLIRLHDNDQRITVQKRHVRPAAASPTEETGKCQTAQPQSFTMDNPTRSCDNHNPDLCTGCNWEPATCCACNEEIEHGQQAFMLQERDFPFLGDDHEDQEWHVAQWHASCDERGKTVGLVSSPDGDGGAA